MNLNYWHVLDEGQSRVRFMEQIIPIVCKYAKEYGYKYPSAIIAQACIEGRYGQSTLAKRYFNLFGMKCGANWKGASVNLETKEEYTPNVETKIRDNFRAFENLEDGIKGYFEFISTPRYKNLKSATSYRDYAIKLKEDGYATSSKYVQTICAVIENLNLNVYDQEEAPTWTHKTMVATANLNVRAMPNTDAKILTTIPKGEGVYVNNWARVKYGNIEGWACTDYLTK